MVMKVYTIGLMLLLAAAAYGQNLDGAPYVPGKDPNIDLYMGSWTESMPRHSHGCLIERDILTTGDPLNPPRKGAVLEYVKRFAWATLNIRNRTTPTTLKGEQEIFYITGGKGTVSWSGKNADLFDGACFLAPEGLEFTLTNTGDEPLTMFLVCEPVPSGFTPKKDIVVKNENTFPIGTKDGHWVYQERDLVTKGDGLATLHAVITLTQDPMTIGHPHFHVRGCEEIWTTIKGQNIAFLGKQLRHQPPGTAYMIPPDGKTNHSNVNQSKTDQIKMLYVATRADIK
jgi:mannose-6-phosphate isomerase-like protein (cupin superfamily)